MKPLHKAVPVEGTENSVPTNASEFDESVHLFEQDEKPSVSLVDSILLDKTAELSLSPQHKTKLQNLASSVKNLLLPLKKELNLLNFQLTAPHILDLALNDNLIVESALLVSSPPTNEFIGRVAAFLTPALNGYRIHIQNSAIMISEDASGLGMKIVPTFPQALLADRSRFPPDISHPQYVNPTQCREGLLALRLPQWFTSVFAKIKVVDPKLFAKMFYAISRNNELKQLSLQQQLAILHAALKDVQEPVEFSTALQLVFSFLASGVLLSPVPNPLKEYPIHIIPLLSEQEEVQLANSGNLPPSQEKNDLLNKSAAPDGSKVASIVEFAKKVEQIIESDDWDKLFSLL